MVIPITKLYYYTGQEHIKMGGMVHLLKTLLECAPKLHVPYAGVPHSHVKHIHFYPQRKVPNSEMNLTARCI